MSHSASHTDVSLLGTILTVWGHPDDETLCSGGIMGEAARNGQTVVCVTATKGELGVRDAKRWPPEHLGQVRAEELEASLRILGVKHHHWLGYKDGDCSNVPVTEAVAKLNKLIDKYKPDTILTFGPDGLTGHDDHRSVSKWVTAATQGRDIQVYHAIQLKHTYDQLKDADKHFNFFFNIDKPPIKDEADCDLCMCLPANLLDKKYHCLRAMPSQYDAMVKTFDEDEIKSMLCCEGFVRAK
jgi:LmbE family N-acetylglucosaminyl deacetylase